VQEIPENLLDIFLLYSSCKVNTFYLLIPYKQFIFFSFFLVYVIFDNYLCHIFIVGYACERELSESSENEKEKAQAIDQAKAWYEANRGSNNDVTLRSGNGNKLTLRPKWSLSSSGQNATYDVVETAITADHVFCFMDEARKEKYKETQDERYLLSKTTLVIRKNKETGETEGFLMTLIPDLSYLESTYFEPFKKNNYLKRDKKFSGHVFYHDMEGRFVNGWRYEGGKVYPIELIPREEGAANIELRAGGTATCDIVVVYIEITECSPIVEYTSGVLTEIGIECGTYGGYEALPYCDGGSTDIGDGSGDYGGGGGSGGGTTVPTNPPSLLDNPCNSGATGNANNNTLLAKTTIKTGMDDVLTDKAKNSANEWSVSIGKNSDGSFSVSAAQDNGSISGTIPPVPSGSYYADGHSHGVTILNDGTKIPSIGVPSPGDLYGFLQNVVNYPTYQTRYVYGISNQIVNGVSVQVSETYAINVYDRGAVAAFLAKYPANTNLMNGLNGWVHETKLFDAYDFALKNFNSNGTYFFVPDAVALAYIMSLFNMGVTLSVKMDNGSFMIISAQTDSSNNTTISVTLCNN